MKKISFHFNRLLLSLGLPLALATSGIYADKTVGATDSQTEDFVYKAQNPLSPTYSLPLKYTHHGGAENGDVSIGSIQPIIPVTLGDWHLINQLSLNFIGTPGVVKGIAELPEPYQGNGVAGLGDTTLTSLFTAPVSNRFMVSFGPAFVFPTDTLMNDIEDRRSRELGSGKFSVGPALTFVTQTKPWTAGLAVKQVWSVFGNNSRHGVSQMVLQPFVNYNLADGWYLLSDIHMIANWNKETDKGWTVPVGGGVGKLLPIGKHALNTRLEGYYNPVRPDLSPEWSANLSVQFLFGK
ncbi:MAG: hypothetical protein PHH11_00110 [Methylomonas sp.]|nr:hypothetical protein [Methylomonas sp.]